MVRITEMEKTEKPWGGECLIDHNEKYALKDIFLKEGTRSSLQSHAMKLETIFVIEGELDLETWDDDGNLTCERYKVGEAYTIKPGMRHRVTAVCDVRVIEASTPELDDVIRHADDFGRDSA